MTYLMIWGHKPSPEEKLTLRRRLGQACLNVPPVVVNVIQSFPCVSLVNRDGKRDQTDWLI